MVNKRFVVFDFDGTIAKTDEIILEIYNEAAKRLSLTQIDPQNLQHLKKLPTRKALKFLTISWHQIPKLWKIIVHEMAERTKEIELYTGMKEVMEYLTKEDILFGVISSNSQQIIESTFKQYGLKEPIFIGTSSAIFKKHTIYKKFCSKHKLTVKKSLYIGDETRDIELGNKLDIPVLSVSWGFNTEATLKEAGASNLIQNPIDLIPLITQFMQTGKATAIA